MRTQGRSVCEMRCIVFLSVVLGVCFTFGDSGAQNVQVRKHIASLCRSSSSWKPDQSESAYDMGETKCTLYYS
jgi:hypothetical protein